jgi:hypothetical protein
MLPRLLLAAIEKETEGIRLRHSRAVFFHLSTNGLKRRGRCTSESLDDNLINAFKKNWWVAG